jgi:hypothetical protein
MPLSRLLCRATLVVTAIATIIAFQPANGQEQAKPRTQLEEPVYRVSNARLERKDRGAVHPLDSAMKVAEDGLKLVRTDVKDYSCILVKRERVNGALTETEYIHCEVRNERIVDGAVVTPFGVYMRFLKPSAVKGREVIYVKGLNGDKLVAREAGKLFKLMPPVWLRPDGPIAMRGQLYPITDIGIENLILKLIEKGERDKLRGARDECQVEFKPGAGINGRKCTLLEVTHPVKRPFFDFHVAQVFIDDELNFPVRYAAYGWPAREGGPPTLLEEYTYLKIKVNIGLEDKDFDHRVKFKRG